MIDDSNRFSGKKLSILVVIDSHLRRFLATPFSANDVAIFCAGDRQLELLNHSIVVPLKVLLVADKIDITLFLMVRESIDRFERIFVQH